MSLPEEYPSDESTASPLQRIGIAVGTLMVVALTVVAAIFLAVGDQSETEPTTVVISSPTGSRPTATQPIVALASPTTAVVLPTDTPTGTPTPSPTASPTPLPPEPTDTPTPLLPTATHTPLPPAPTFTPTPVTPTATSAPPPAPSTPGDVCPPPPGWEPYVVQPGDTLDLLAKRTESSVPDIRDENCLETFALEAGQTLYLPSIPATSTVTPTSTPKTPTLTPTSTGTATATPRPPEIFSSEPASGINSDKNTIAVQGRNFQVDKDGFRVELRKGGVQERLELGDLATITSFEAKIPVGLPPGTYDLWVINPDDQFDTKDKAYESKTPTPTLTPTP